jgi:hypothetical protein
MKDLKTSKEEALKRINGRIISGNVLYWDDATRRYYVGPESDLDDLCDLMDSPHTDISRDAYSHWCASCNHGDGYETVEEAEASANLLGDYDGQAYKAVNPTADTDELAKEGMRVILYHESAGCGLHTARLYIAPKGMIFAGWVVGLIVE